MELPRAETPPINCLMGLRFGLCPWARKAAARPSFMLVVFPDFWVCGIDLAVLVGLVLVARPPPPNNPLIAVFSDPGISKLRFIFPDNVFDFEFPTVLVESLPMFKALGGKAEFCVVARWAGSWASTSFSSPVMKVLPRGGNSTPSTALSFKPSVWRRFN